MLVDTSDLRGMQEPQTGGKLRAWGLGFPDTVGADNCLDRTGPAVAYTPRRDVTTSEFPTADTTRRDFKRSDTDSPRSAPPRLVEIAAEVYFVRDRPRRWRRDNSFSIESIAMRTSDPSQPSSCATR